MGRLYAGNYELAIIEMMKKILLLLFVTTALGAVAAPARSYEVKSPDGTLSIVLSVGDRLSFSVLRNGAELVASSRIALTLSTGEVLGENPKVRSAHRRSVAETVEAPLHRQSSLDIAFNELNLRCRDGYGIIARAYDDGVCYRFYTERDGELTIMDETAQLNFADDPSAYIPYANTKIPMRTSFENTYTYAPLSEFRTGTLAFMPILVDLGARGYVLYTESDVESYPGIYVGYDAGAKGLTARFAGYPIEMSLTKRFEDIVETSEEYIARVAGSRSYPWRIVACAETAAELPVNDMVWKTAEASRVSDVSWIRDGKIAWDWWNDWGVYGVDFKSGINTETYKYFIDFAAEHGIEYVALDEGWSVRDGDILHVIPEIDLPQIVSYGRQKGVGIVLWVVAKVLDDKLEEACAHYAAMGVAGWKVDFIDRQDQAAVDRVYRIAEAAARHRMIIDFHGIYKPTGLQRTYPNVVNFEGIFGLEQLKWTDRTKADMPAYDCTFPFIRQVAGPVDYTQGAMRNASRKNFRAVNDHPMSQGTRAHQVAAYVVFDSPLVMLCDSPTAYLKEPQTLDYIVRFPTRFDRTIVPAGEIGRYIVTVRRAGDRWYLGALTNWDARDVEVKLDFLGDGRWNARIFRDGVNADRYGEDYILEERTVTASETLTMPMAPGGGYAVQFERLN